MNRGIYHLSTLVAYFIFALALLLATCRATLAPVPISSHLVINNQVSNHGVSGIDLRSFLPITGISSHTASITELIDGTIACTWFSGSREGARDVVIYLSFFRNDSWSIPTVIASPKQTRNDTGRFILKVGNPVLAVDTEGRLHLWYVSTSIGGWATSSINHRISTDNGKSWSNSRRIVTAPFFNMSTLVRMPPLLLDDGSFLLPTYHELATHHGEVTRLAADGITVLSKDRLPADRPLLQPSIVSLPERGELLAVMRKGGNHPGTIGASYYSDAKGAWAEKEPPAIKNPNSSIALLRLNDGRLLLACNPCSKGRQVLSLLLSTDGGSTWREALSIERSGDIHDEFSYPSLLQDRRGLIHLVYTWNRERIAHRVISPDILANGLSGESS